MVLPTAVYSRCFHYVLVLTVERAELVRRIDVKYKYPVRVKIIADKRKASFKPAPPGQVIHAVKAGNDRRDRAVKLKAPHILTEPQNSVTARFPPPDIKHFAGGIDGNHIIAHFRKRQGDVSRPAGEVKNQRTVRYTVLPEPRRKKSRVSKVVDMRIQPVVISGKRGILGVHFLRSRRRRISA